jgi:hypothetical protein
MKRRSGQYRWEASNDPDRDEWLSSNHKESIIAKGPRIFHWVSDQRLIRRCGNCALKEV